MATAEAMSPCVPLRGKMKLFNKVSLTCTQCLAIEIVRLKLTEVAPTVFVHMDIRKSSKGVTIDGMCSRDGKLLRFYAVVTFDGTLPVNLLVSLKNDTGGNLSTDRLDDSFVQSLMQQFGCK